MSKLLEVKDLCKYFKTPKGALHAVEGLSFSIDGDTTLGVVGESRLRQVHPGPGDYGPA